MTSTTTSGKTTSLTTLIRPDALWGHDDGTGVLVRGGRISGIVGPADADTAAEAASRTLRLEGTLLPGLTDAHTHPLMGAEMSRGVELTHVDTIDELRAELAAARTGLAPGDWLFGWGLEHKLWAGADPTSDAIEDVTAGTPTSLRMFDGHSMLVNSAALAASGITAERVYPTGSRVAVDAAGAPTGYLIEMEAMELAMAAFPEETRDAVVTRLGRILTGFAAAGLTGTHVMDANSDAATAYAALEQRGAFPVRLKVHPWVSPGTGLADWQAIATTIGEGGERWGIHGVKLFIDGTIDNGTAWLREPDRDGASRASAWSDPESYRAAIAFFAERGIPTATHAIGDAGVLHAAGAIADANRAHPGTRHRIEHLELTGDDVIDAVRRSGAIASMQPTHCTHFVNADGSDNWSSRIGDRRAHAWRIGSLETTGTPIALGSDWPIAGYPPLPILAAAKLRRPAGSSSEPVLIDEAIELAAAIDGYTSGAAFAAGTEAWEGSIAVGQRADFTLLGIDPRRVDAETLSTADVLGTFLDGEAVGEPVDA